ERIILPDSSCLIHFMLIDIQYIVSNIVVNEVNIQRNLSLSEGKIFSQTLMLKLVEKGMKKEKAYRLMQDISLNMEGKFVDIVKINPTVKRYLSENEIEKACTYEYYTNHINDIFRRFSKS
ncbi:MAG TPA: adenylosuccinate lyase, partial [Candidatus Dojkabacteria bacterium]|nr:adenylosuccinate lyase [Candidatus Dojkabacteria bacterium]